MHILLIILREEFLIVFLCERLILFRLRLFSGGILLHLLERLVVDIFFR